MQNPNMRAHLLLVNKRDETLVDGSVEDFQFTGASVRWITRRILGDESEDHEHELDVHEVSHLSWAVYTQDPQDPTLV